MDWASFFPPGSRVLALPSWRGPRLYLPARGPSERWAKSDLYPASRLGGRALRAMLRAGAAAGLTEARVSRSGGWVLEGFVRDVLPAADSAVVLVGEPGPVQKFTAQLWDADGGVVGYLKYAERGPARERLLRERLMLAVLPEGVGPASLKYGPVADGEALLVASLPGKRLPAALPPPAGAEALLGRLAVSGPVPVDEHPWARNARERSPAPLDPWLEALKGRRWPVVVQHGDFAPWNVIRGPGGAVGAVDWEYGAPECLPHMDLAFYVLQVSALVRRWRPEKAARYAAAYLAGDEGRNLSRGEAGALVRLSAHDLCLKHLEDGYARHPKLRAWLRVVWEGAWEA